MLTIIGVSLFLVVICVGIHYQSLVRLSKLIERPWRKHRSLINLLVIGAIVSHVIEITVYASAYSLLSHYPEHGHLQSAEGEVSTDYWYFSFVSYTSLGFGDITPVGHLRFVTAVETLTGLVLIAWTASFLFLEMQQWAVTDRSEQSHPNPE